MAAQGEKMEETRAETRTTGGKESEPARERAEERPKEERRARGERREHRLRDLARRILADRDRGEREHPDPDGVDEGGRDLQDTAREAVLSLLETGDRAKTEFMRLLAREVRSYLTELRVGEGLQHMLTNYSLELHASVNLKPLVEGEETPPTTVKIKPVAKKKDERPDK